jgi:hypothetical protein
VKLKFVHYSVTTGLGFDSEKVIFRDVMKVGD